MGKRLELIWPNKDRVLLGVQEDGRPIWGTKEDLESRLLVQLEAVGHTNPDKLDDLYEQGDNLLIKGDNLLALKSLEKHFAGKIKCIFIDPPYNTGSAFKQYDDGVEHSLWLSLMRDRLEIFRKLMSSDGSIWVAIDDNECHYLKVLMDEVFGRASFVANVVWQSKDTPGNNATGIAETHNHILAYKNSEQFHPNLLERNAEQLANYTNPDDDARGPWLAAPLTRVEHRDRDYYAIKNKTGREVFPPKGSSWRRPPAKMKELAANDRIWWGKDGNAEFPMEKKFLSEVKEGVVNQTWWPYEFAGSTRNASAELKGLFKGEKAFETPKPEKLAFRVLELATRPGDWVLDSFAGSGTTGAVAHKMGRKWIGIEIGEHAETLCLPRLKRVVSGEDQAGVSKQVGWKGGGGFRYCVLGESLFAKDKDTGLVMINPKFTNGPLVNAVCALEDFGLNDDPVLQGIRGNIYAHVTEERLTQAYVDSLVETLPENRALNIYCLKRDYRLEWPDRVKIKRIPKDLRIPRYLRGDGNGKRSEARPEAAVSPPVQPPPEKKAKDTKRLLEVLRNARLRGPRDWAANIDHYVYGGTASGKNEASRGGPV